MRARPRAGFTLLEIAVALAITGIGMVACMQIFSGSLRLQDRAARQSRAVLAARMGMDELLMRPTDDLHDGCGPCRVKVQGFQLSCCVRKAGPEDGVEAPEDTESPAEQELRFLEVAVAWQDGTRDKNYTVRSMRLTPSAERE
jgi:prepilin-type N-terminal cleavage/methylation domain-containing protein